MRRSYPALSKMMRPLDLGPLPVEAINRVLGLNLATTAVHFSARAQQHAHSRHPEAFAICMRHVHRIVAAPDYVGRAPGRADGFEMIGEVSKDQVIVLVAIKLPPADAGRLLVSSTYLIDRAKLERRIRKGFLKTIR